MLFLKSWQVVEVRRREGCPWNWAWWTDTEADTEHGDMQCCCPSGQESPVSRIGSPTSVQEAVGFSWWEPLAKNENPRGREPSLCSPTLAAWHWAGPFLKPSHWAFLGLRLESLKLHDFTGFQVHQSTEWYKWKDIHSFGEPGELWSVPLSPQFVCNSVFPLGTSY